MTALFDMLIMTDQNRRRFLRGVGATGATVGLAGCLGELGRFGEDESPDGTPDETGTPSEEPTPTATDDERDDGEVLVDFAEGVDDWYGLDDAGSFEATTDVRNGEYGIRLLGDEDDPHVGAVRAFSEPLDLRGRTLSISFRASAPQIHRIELQLVAPDQANRLRLNRTNTGPRDHWLTLDMGASGEVGDPDLGEVYELRLIGRDRGQEAPIDMVVDEIRLHESPDTGKVMLTWDDGHHTQWRAFEIMQEYGFPGVDGVPHHAVGSDANLDRDQLREMQAAGWDIVSHPHPESNGSAVFTDENWSEREQRRIIEDSIEWLEDNGFEDGARHYIAPGNLRGPTNLELLREYHESSMSFGAGNVGLPVTDPHAIGRIDGYDAAVVKEYVDLAAKYNQLVAVLWHTIGDDPEEFDITETEFRDLLDHVEAADVDVVTQSDIVS